MPQIKVTYESDTGNNPLPDGAYNLKIKLSNGAEFSIDLREKEGPGFEVRLRSMDSMTGRLSIIPEVSNVVTIRATER